MLKHVSNQALDVLLFTFLELNSIRVLLSCKSKGLNVF